MATGHPTLLALCLEVWIKAEFSHSGWNTGSGVRRVEFLQNAQGKHWGSGFGRQLHPDHAQGLTD